MTKEEIIALAREAGLCLVYSEQDEDGWEELGRFAALVAAAEREACARVCEQFFSVEGIAQDCLERFAALVAAAEREACAAVCREDWVELKGWDMATAEVIRKAIRDRGQE